jgi:hypothetical protein
MWATSVIFVKLSKANNHPMGENSPNLVTQGDSTQNVSKRFILLNIP